uniref:non-specific serine/threonine protein kinase n=1 Tax=Solanum tuberosum TaxID=4113 RepID=M0ZTM4_SOLTU
MDGSGAGSDESQSTRSRVLVERLRSLEASYVKLREQFNLLLEEKSTSKDSDEDAPGSYCGPGVFYSGNPYRNVLEDMGHALYVTKIAMHYVKRLSCGQSWTDQFPFKKRSGEIFMAIVSKSLMYEDGELFGVVTVSSDAAFLNKINSEKSRTSQSSNEQPGRRGINFKSTGWHPQSQTASFVPNLASKVFSFNRGEDAHRDREEVEVDTIGGQSQKPPRAPVAKVMSKLNITGFGNIGGEKCGNIQQNGNDETFANVNVTEPDLPSSSEGKYTHVLDAYHDFQSILKGSCFTQQRTNAPENAQITSTDVIEGPIATCSRKFDDQINANYHKPQIGNSKLPAIEDSSGQKLENQQSRKSGGNTRSSHGSSSNKNENELSLIVHCEIRWEDISLSEEIGQGAFGVVYHGIWKGSDVAVKVFFGNQRGETTLLDYKKEIDIMKRLRHPNVLLFMGAVSSQEKLAIITEYMPRGSLFKVLHRNNPPLDLKRRLRMALDVARGMCYLHRRNPPIVHRDLKSSNLLVDKSWTVKVGDFGLSKLKHATFLTANSGRGTPQWMAPEVLRNEPSTEKSDVFSFGVILWELMTESIPWKDLNPLQVVGVVGFMDGRLDIPQKLDPRISAIILDCWQSKPELRPSFEDISRRMTDIILSFGGLTSRKNSGGMVSNTD